jgi:polyketide cyclase/dehydrase/lipid transport protein
MSSSYAVTATSAAAPEQVFAVLVRGATWPSWSPIDEFTLDGDGDPDGPQGVGAVRLFRTGRQVSREPITALVPGRRFVYVNESPPWRHYRGVVDLEPAAGGGTLITWSGTFTARTPGTGWFWRLFLTVFMRRMAVGLARYAVGPGPT